MLPEPLGTNTIPFSGSSGTMSCLDCLHVYSCSLMGLIIISSFTHIYIYIYIYVYYNIDIKLKYLETIYIYMIMICLIIVMSLILSMNSSLSFISYYLMIYT